MGNHAGFDTDIYPGDRAMRWLRTNTNFEWCGFYLAPAPTHKNSTWMKKYRFLKSLEWGLAPLYVGRQTFAAKAKKKSIVGLGTKDGQSAAALAAVAGFPPDSLLFLDIEAGPGFPQAMLHYYQAWITAVRAGKYKGGVYCSYKTAGRLSNHFPSDGVWVWNLNPFPHQSHVSGPYPDPNPANSGYAAAICWQLMQDTKIGLWVKSRMGRSVVRELLKVDLDTSIYRDPASMI